MDEAIDLTGREAGFDFLGSPVISVAQNTEIILPNRFETFRKFGFRYRAGGEQYQLYEAPHGVLADSKNGDTQGGEILVRYGGEKYSIHLHPSGARPRLENGKDSDLLKMVMAWSQLFDDLLNMAQDHGFVHRLPWHKAFKYFRPFLSLEERKEPQKALIIDIAEKMNPKVRPIVMAIRRILMRERRLIAAHRVEEVDTTCLRWMARQPGTGLAIKAAANRHRLTAVVRQERVDTLENRVLKDFLKRCAKEGRRYLDNEVDYSNKNSKRAQLARTYTGQCSDLKQLPQLANISKPGIPLQPNYVLQNDLRYREVWRHYLRLLKQDEVKDCLWDWQARTWADVVRLLIGLALYYQAKGIKGFDQGKELHVEELAASSLYLNREHNLGSRLVAGSEPGPFLVHQPGACRYQGAVMEMVHSDQAERHPVVSRLGRLGGHLYLVLHPLSGGDKMVIIVWAIHTAGSDLPRNHEEIQKSAERSLSVSRTLVNDHQIEQLRLAGLIVASELQSKKAVDKESGPKWWPGSKGLPHYLALPARSWDMGEITGSIQMSLGDMIKDILP